MATKPDDAPMLGLINLPADTPATPANQARIVLLNPERFDQFYERIKAETDKHTPDVTTAKGRDEVKALAFRVTKTKTSLDREAKNLTEDWRLKTKAVNDARKPMIERLDALAAEVRRPVTEWEEAEAARVERNRATVQRIRDAATVAPEDTAATVTERGRAIWAQEAPKDMDELEYAAFAYAKDDTVKALVSARNRLTQEEADRAELARLREAEARRVEREAEEQRKRDEADRIEREAREKEEDEQRERDVAEQRRKDEEQRIADAERAAEDRAKEEAQRVADAAEAKRKYARDIIDHIHEVGRGRIGGQVYPYGILLRELESKIELDDSLGDMIEQVRAVRDSTLELVKMAMQRDSERRQKEADDQEAEAKRLADAKRAEDQAHVVAVMGAAKRAIVACGADEAVAKAIVVAIKGGLVPAVTIAF